MSWLGQLLLSKIKIREKERQGSAYEEIYKVIAPRWRPGGLGGRAMEHPVEGSLPDSLHQHLSVVRHQHRQDANNAVMARGDAGGAHAV